MKRLGVLLLLGGLMAAPLAQAHVRVGISAGYYPAYYHPHRHHGGFHPGYFSAGPGWYGPGAYHGYGVIYEPPVVIRESAPVVVTQAPSVQPQPAMWYFCPSLKAYYPYVEHCPEGWTPVPATPPDTQGKKK